MKPGLEIDENVAYEKRFWVVQTIFWVLMFLLILSSIAGFLGPGLVLKKTAGESTAFSAEFERVLRTERTTAVKLSIPGRLNAC